MSRNPLQANKYVRIYEQFRSRRAKKLTNQFDYIRIKIVACMNQ